MNIWSTTNRYAQSSGEIQLAKRLDRADSFRTFFSNRKSPAWFSQTNSVRTRSACHCAEISRERERKKPKYCNKTCFSIENGIVWTITVQCCAFAFDTRPAFAPRPRRCCRCWTPTPRLSFLVRLLGVWRAPGSSWRAVCITNKQLRFKTRIVHGLWQLGLLTHQHFGCRNLETWWFCSNVRSMMAGSGTCVWV